MTKQFKDCATLEEKAKFFESGMGYETRICTVTLNRELAKVYRDQVGLYDLHLTHKQKIKDCCGDLELMAEEDIRYLAKVEKHLEEMFDEKIRNK